MRRVLSWAFIVAGLALVLSPFIRDGYSIYTQRQLLGSIERMYPSAGVTELGEGLPAAEGQGPAAPPVLQPDKPIKAVMVLEIPRLNLKTAVVRGVTPKDLSRGPGLFPDSNMPGEIGNVAIAGHRNVSGSWFRHLNRLESGDRLSISCQGRNYEYRVEKVYIVAENDWSVVAPTDYKALTLITCDPPGNVSQRLIVRARQID